MHKEHFFIALGLAALAGFLYIRRKSSTNDLTAQMQEVEDKKRIGAVATAVNNVSVPPMAELGDTPLAGIHFDPFNVFNPAAAPKGIDYMKSILLN